MNREGLELHADARDLPREPVARFLADVATTLGLMLGRVELSDALADGRLRVEGDAEAAVRLRAAFLAPAPAVAPA